MPDSRGHRQNGKDERIPEGDDGDGTQRITEAGDGDGMAKGKPSSYRLTAALALSPRRAARLPTRQPVSKEEP